MKKLAIVALLSLSCTAAQKEEAFDVLNRTKELMSGTCVRGMAWEACIEKCEHKAKAAEGGGGHDNATENQ